ncbi:MAG: histidinol phosphatase-like enzyme (inositol monophosphatase family) [Paracoccaceae bacterium]|jgi:histidinol phosphatase-like enzyme (inositol monophosphatase family)
MLSVSEQVEIQQTAQKVAEAARQAILPLFRHADLSTQNKASEGFDPVTQADRAAETAMRAVICAHRPDDSILGEEFEAVAGTSGLTWILDPIDGTRGFLSGTPTWGVLIAVNDAHGPIYGLIDQPYTAERWCGGFGERVFSGPLGTRALAVRDTRLLSDAIVYSTFPEVGTPAEGAAFHALSQQACLTRYGMDCYAYGLLALGQIDLVVEAGLFPYDVCAPIAVIEAAGGLVTDWQGGPAHGGGRILAAANADIHAQALAYLKEV